MNEKPKYVMRRNEIVMVCDRPPAVACAELAMRRDRGGNRESDWWGHPSLSTLPDGTPFFRAPVNAKNILLMYECGAVPADDATRARIGALRSSIVEFKTPLPVRPFQREGIGRLLGRNLAANLSFDAGLGKTLTAIAAMRTDPARFFPCLVFAPAHVKLNWADPETGEWAKWGGEPKEAVVLFGRKPDASVLAGRKLIVLNHQILAAWADTLLSVGPKTLLIDEAHDFVNSNTKTYPIVERLARAVGGRVLLLTATPLVNDLGDLWGLCNLISPDLLGTKTVFTDTFMPEEHAKARLLASRWRGGFERGAWRDVAKCRLPKALKDRRIEELSDILRRTVLLRKKRSEVVDQLPDITETRLRIEIPQDSKGAAFWDVERRCEFEIAEGKEDILASDKSLSAYGRAKRNAVFAKLPYAEAWIRDFLKESDPSEKLVVVGWAVEPLEKLHAAFGKESLLVNGSLDARKKHEVGRRFSAEADKRVFFGNMKSVGTGIDSLVCASTMLFIELPQTAMELEQLKGRIDRLSQTSMKLAYYYMTIRGSIEEKHGWAIIDRKQKLARALGL